MSSRKRFWAAVFAVHALAGWVAFSATAVVNAPRLPSTARLDLQAFEEIKQDMRPDEVEKLLGVPPGDYRRYSGRPVTPSLFGAL